MKKLLMLTAVWLTGLMAGHAQEAEAFSIATLKVDGLPQKILVAKVNPDGPGGGGSGHVNTDVVTDYGGSKGVRNADGYATITFPAN